jgi:uncharacterized membrane protein YphA (DoxX/SURF4 family)
LDHCPLFLGARIPVSWLDPVTAAWFGETIEIVGPPLLVFGLATRFAALPMLILSLVIQFSFQGLGSTLVLGDFCSDGLSSRVPGRSHPTH